jgi:tripartite ATP-independent transporter DctP family solute receptor
MKRRAIWGIVFVISLCMILSISANQAVAIEKRTLQMSTISPPDNLWSQAGARYADAVKKRTGGNVTIEIAYSGSTGTARETIEALQIGTNDIVIQTIARLGVYDPLPGIAAYPYLIRDIDHFENIYYGPVGKEFFAEVEKRTGFHVIGAGYRGAREMASKKKIVTPDDLKGLKIRVPNTKLYRRTWEVLGANPVPMPSLEVYTSLQQGIIDACENPLEAHIRSKYYEAAKYVIMTSHVRAFYTFIFWGKTFNSLSPELQKILTEEGQNAMQWGTEETLKRIKGFEKTLKDRGAEFVYPDVAAFRSKLKPMKNDFPELAEWIDKFDSVQ